MNVKKNLAVMTILCSAASSASASLLVYEPFDYAPAGTAIAGLTNTSSTGSPTWAAAGAATTPVHQIESGNLTAPTGFPAPIGNSGSTRNADWTQFDRLSLGAGYGTNTSLYYSLLLNVPATTGLTVSHTNLNANNDAIIMFNNATGASGTRPSNWAGELVTRLGSVANTYNVGIRASNTTANTTYWTGDLTPGDTHLVVVRYSQGATDSSGADDLNSIWIDPSSTTFGLAEANVPAPDGSSDGTINSSSPTVNFAASLAIGAGIAAGTAPSQINIDEIRVGETWADVTTVPEPASLGLLAFAGVGLLRRKR
jgi:hypothetical protein